MYRLASLQPKHGLVEQLTVHCCAIEYDCALLSCLYADPVGYRVVLEGHLSSNAEELAEALRRSSGLDDLQPQSEELPSCFESAFSNAAGMCADADGSCTEPQAATAADNDHGLFASMTSGSSPRLSFTNAAGSRSYLTQAASPCACGSRGLTLDGRCCSCNPAPLVKQETLATCLDTSVLVHTDAFGAPGNPCSNGDIPPRPLTPSIASPCLPGEAVGPNTSDESCGDSNTAFPPSSHCTCPPYAVKATCGKRSMMEDTYAMCPNICELPMATDTCQVADKLPHRIAVQFENGCMYLPGLPSAPSPALPALHSEPQGFSRLTSHPTTLGADAEHSVGSFTSSDGSVEKLHFFGVYDGHGGIEASQHCAKRLHHHLSKALLNIAAGMWVDAGHEPLSAGSCDSDAHGGVGGLNNWVPNHQVCATASSVRVAACAACAWCEGQRVCAINILPNSTCFCAAG